MSLLDLSRVTRTFITLIDEAIKASPAWAPPPPAPPLPNPDVIALPPDRLEGDNVVGLYLYHMSEDASVKSRAWPNRPPAPVRFSPMGLNLHYVLSAHSDLPSNTGPYREQLLMGLAAKALHDYPTIDKDTQIKGVPILDPGLGDDRVRITLRPVPPNEAVSYWTAGSKPLRLSCYYEVSVVLMDPEEPETGGGRVLLYGIQTFVSPAPSLTSSRSVVTFRLPTETTDRKVDAQPARAAPGEEVTFFGADLVGDQLALLIKADRWTDAEEADAAWGAVFAGDRVFATVQTTAGAKAVLPGTYQATVKVIRRFTMPDGSVKDVAQTSNATPFQVVPAVVVPPPPYPGGEVVITGNTYQHADLDPDAIKIFLGGVALTRWISVPISGPFSPGMFRIVSATELRILIPTALPSGSDAQLRVIINASECAPRWVKVP